MNLWNTLLRRIPFLVPATALTAGMACRAWAESPMVSVVTDKAPGPAAAHGLGKLTAALRAKGIACEMAGSLGEARGKFLIVAGLAAGDGPAARLLKAGNHPVPQGPEALVIRETEWQGKPVWVIAGSDDRGLMYARTGRGRPHRLERRPQLAA